MVDGILPLQIKNIILNTGTAAFKGNRKKKLAHRTVSDKRSGYRQSHDFTRIHMLTLSSPHEDNKPAPYTRNSPSSLHNPNSTVKK